MDGQLKSSPAINVFHPPRDAHVQQSCPPVVHCLLLTYSFEQVFSLGRVFDPRSDVFNGGNAVVDRRNFTRLGDYQVQ